MTDLTDRGIISLADTGNAAVLTTHFRLDLFNEEGVLTIGSGDLTLSDGFTGSLAAEILLGNSLGFDLASDVNLSVIADVDELLALDQALTEEGLSIGDLFGTSAVTSIVVDEADPEKLALLAGLDNADLLDVLTGVDVPAGGSFVLPIALYSEELDLTGLDSIVAVGSADQIADFMTQGSGEFDVPTAVLDLVEEYQITSGVLTLPATEFLTDGPVYTPLGGGANSGLVLVSGDAAAYTDAAFDAASRINDGLSASHVYELNGDFADTFGGPALVPGGGVLGASDYTFAENEGLLLTGALQDNAQYSIELIFHFDEVNHWNKIIDFEQQTDAQGLYTNPSAELNFWNFVTAEESTFVAGEDRNLVLTRDASTSEVIAYVDGVQQFSFIDSTGAAIFVEDMFFFEDDHDSYNDEAAPGVVDRIAIYDSVLNPSNVTNLFLGEELDGSGRVDLLVVDDADTITTLAGSLGATIDGFAASYEHQVGAGDTVTSFAGAKDLFIFEAGVITEGNLVHLAGDFDLDLDIIDISAATLIIDGDNSGPLDFAFIGFDQSFGTRTLNHVDGKDPVDIRITEGSTHIEFDGLAGLYNGVADFEIELGNNVASGLDVFNFFDLHSTDQISLTDFNNSLLIPLQELQRFDGLELVSSNAGSAYNQLDMVFHGPPDPRLQEIIRASHPDGDTLIGSEIVDILTGDGLSPAVDDVIFGLDGNDILNGGTGGDRLNGGEGDDTLTALGAKLLDGGAGNDSLELSGVYTSNNDVELFGGEDSDVINVLASVVTAGSEVVIFGGDDAAGDDGDDIITVSGSLAALDGNVRVYGDKGSDSILIADTAVLTATDEVEIFGQHNGIDSDGDDIITIAGRLTSIEGAVLVHGDDGNDNISITGSAVLTALDEVEIYGKNGNSGGDGNDVINIAGSIISTEGQVNIWGWDGTDIITISETASVVSVLEKIRVRGSGENSGSGNNTIVIAGTLTADNSVEIQGDDSDDSISINAAAFITSNNNGVDIHGLDGNDSITINGSANITADFEIKIEGDDGDDSIAISDSAIITSQSDKVEIRGGAGDDSITIDGAVTIVAARDVEIDGGDGNDNITIAGSIVSTDNVKVTGGDGNDTISLLTETDDILVDGGGGDDVLASGPGHDLLSGGLGLDKFTYASTSAFGDVIQDYSGTSANDLFQFALGLFPTEVVYTFFTNAPVTVETGGGGPMIINNVVPGGPAHVHMLDWGPGTAGHRLDLHPSYVTAPPLVISATGLSTPSGPALLFKQLLTEIHATPSMDVTGPVSEHLSITHVPVATPFGIVSSSILLTHWVPFSVLPSSGPEGYVAFGMINKNLVMATILNSGSARIVSSEVVGQHTIAEVEGFDLMDVLNAQLVLI